MKKCLKCGFENINVAKFCNECGTVFNMEKKDELKIITILFADIKGFTAMSEKLSPDEVKEIIDNIFNILTEIIEKSNGEVIKYEGDCIMAGFGLDKSDERDPFSACECSLQMQGELKKFSLNLEKEKKLSLSMRIGLHTGDVVLGLIGGRKDILGDSVNLAARMEQSCPVGEILITKDLFNIIGAEFILEKQEPIYVKGKSEPINTFVLKGKKFNYSKKILGKDIKIVGRIEELKEINNYYNKVLNGNDAEIFILQGESGLGKTRLINEFISKNNFKFVKSYFNSSTNSDYHIFKNFFLTQIEKPYENSIYEYLKKNIQTDNLDILHKYSKIICYYMDFKFFKDDFIDKLIKMPETLSKILFKCMEELFSAISKKEPFVIICEDIEWADNASIKLLSHLVKWVKGKLFILCSSNKNTLDNFIEVSGNEIYIHNIKRLNQENIKNLMIEILGSIENFSETFINKIIKISKGNPFFIEEYILSLVEKKILKKINSQWMLNEEVEEIEIPTSIKYIVQSRIENLEKSEIELLKICSVMGKKFIKSTISQIYNKNIDNCIKIFLENGLIIRDSEFNIFNFDFFVFSQDIIREVVYNKLTKKQKKEYHNKLGIWLETYAESSNDENIKNELSGEICSNYYNGENFDKSFQYGVKTGSYLYNKFEPLNAVKYYNIAYRSIFKFNQEEFKIISFLEDYLNCIKHQYDINLMENIIEEVSNQIHLENENKIILLLIYGTLLIEIPDYEKSIKNIEIIESLMHDSTENNVFKLNMARFYSLKGIYYKRINDMDSSFKNFNSSLEIFKQLKIPEKIAECFSNIGVNYYNIGQYNKAMEFYDQALMIYESIKNEYKFSCIINNIALIHSENKETDKAIELFEKCLEFERRIGDRKSVSDTLINVATEYINKEQYEKAIETYKEALKLKIEIGDKGGISAVCTNLGEFYSSQGSFEKALEYVFKALKIDQEIEDQIYISGDLYLLGVTYFKMGKIKEGIKYIQEAINIYEEITDVLGLFYCYFSLAEHYYECDNIQEAKKYLKLAEENVKQTEIEDLIKDCEKFKSKLFK